MALFNPATAKIKFNAFERSRFSQVSTAAELYELEADRYRLPVCVASELPLFSVRIFPSGEISGAYYLSGASSKVKPPERSGPVTTSSFSAKSKAKIRRAVENSGSDLVSFLTLTFSPWDLKPWQVDSYRLRVEGLSVRSSVKVVRTNRRRSLALVPRVSLRRRRVNVVCPIVRQDYAKYRLKNMRSALTMKVNRQIACKLKELPEEQHEQYIQEHKFRMVWVAELQENGNIHFHALTNKYFAFKYLNRLWPYGYTQIKKLKDANHAAHYMTKYISKDADSVISGNRYNISQILRKESKPMIYGLEDKEAIAARILLKKMKEMVEARGGRVIDSGFGVNIPRPRRSRDYRDEKTGTIKKSKGCGSLSGDKVSIHKAFIGSIFPCLEAYSSGPVPF